MALGSMRQKRKTFTPPRLMITSLMDMFTIILIFLLFSFSDNPETITLDANLDLPRSEAKLDHEECIRLVFTRDSLKLEDEVIATVQEGHIVGLDPKNLKNSELYKKLRKIYEDSTTNAAPSMNIEEAVAEDDTAATRDLNIPDKKKPLLFLCDKQHTFKSINQVIKTAGMAGFPNFQFAVLKK
ncbi:MAG: biopolymer transporter ExbD [Desulfosarcinaceae bacterium]|nr:biopolymer transporter ExbD [Desulfosarcinaceae bacterium]